VDEAFKALAQTCLARVSLESQPPDKFRIMISLNKICEFMDQFAPIRLAEEWDNVGLLVGDSSAGVSKLMTCLTVTPESVEEAISAKADLIISHHPLPFRPLKKITSDQLPGKLLLQLIGNRVAVYSPHTCFDSAEQGINQQLSERIGLSQISPLVPLGDGSSDVGSGRLGVLHDSLLVSEFLQRIKSAFRLQFVRYAGRLNHRVSRVAVACGSGGGFLAQALVKGCDTMITGEGSFHTCVEAAAANVTLVLLGHYCSERFAVETLATRLKGQFPELDIWASRNECDPVKYL
jgi:dinuclear metal center YbgI/SA1388 family protein